MVNDRLGLFRGVNSSTRHDLDRTVIVAVVAVRMMQMAVDQVIHVIAVRNGRMTTAGTMHVCRVVATARMSGSAGVGIGFCHVERVLFNGATRILVVQMTVVQVVHVSIVLHGNVSAARSMLMRVVGVNLLGG